MLIAGGILAYANRQHLKDLYIVNTTDISSQSAQLAKQLELTDEGEFLYQASQSEVQEAKQFRSSCSGLEQNNIVLGCYTKQRVYVYEVDDTQLDGVQQVTAAHEVLHAAYERLSSAERREIDELLQKHAQTVTDARVKETLALYKKAGTEDLLNEMHSIFGTELKKLSPQLEQHYSRYFKDRATIVAYSQKYQKKFTDLERKRESYDAQLKTLKSQIDSGNAELEAQNAQIESLQKTLESLRSSGSASAYNQRVPSFNQAVQAYNASLTELRSKITEYNSIVKLRNELAVSENDLANQLDSSKATLR